jgi:hypothetical protein
MFIWQMQGFLSESRKSHYYSSIKNGIYVMYLMYVEEEGEGDFIFELSLARPWASHLYQELSVNRT